MRFFITLLMSAALMAIGVLMYFMLGPSTNRLPIAKHQKELVEVTDRLVAKKYSLENKEGRTAASEDWNRARKITGWIIMEEYQKDNFESEYSRTDRIKGRVGTMISTISQVKKTTRDLKKKISAAQDMKKQFQKDEKRYIRQMKKWGVSFGFPHGHQSFEVRFVR